jgi:hypothetical protein
VFVRILQRLGLLQHGLFGPLWRLHRRQLRVAFGRLGGQPELFALRVYGELGELRHHLQQRFQLRVGLLLRIERVYRQESERRHVYGRQSVYERHLRGRLLLRRRLRQGLRPLQPEWFVGHLHGGGAGKYPKLPRLRRLRL